MEKQELYYTHYNVDGELTRIAKIVDLCDAYAFDKKEKKWISMQGLIRILFDGSLDFNEITKEEAERLIKDF